MTKKEELINPKMLMSKEELGIPDYYVGKVYGYEARKVVEDFDLSYNLATACSYLLRAKNKHSDGGVQDIRKAINHLHFELDKLHNGTL
jgi:hypothetical protein|tara:strand:+ start:9888 stop:10154 length:267 start_codon:yes stop_codon:yes gene_type:complete